MQQVAVIRQLDVNNEDDVHQMTSLTHDHDEPKAISAIEAANGLYEKSPPTKESFSYRAMAGSDDFMQIAGDVYSAGGRFAGIRGNGSGRLRALAAKTMAVNIKLKLQNAIKYQRLTIGTQVEQYSNVFGNYFDAKKKWWKVRRTKTVTWICHAINGHELTSDDHELMNEILDEEARERAEQIIDEHRRGLCIVTSYQQKQSEWSEYRRSLAGRRSRGRQRKQPIAPPSPDGLTDRFIVHHPIQVIDYIMKLLKIQEEVPGSRRFTPFPSWSIGTSHAHIDLKMLYYMLG